MIHIGLHPEPGGLSVRDYPGGMEAPYLSGFHGEMVKWWLVLMSKKKYQYPLVNVYIAMERSTIF